ncbi:MAG: peptidoglycan DD-metalloendopeptidase family protein [Clostridia bacterium]|nr:peptidoglycan DD-metalloendopeptidase family protein [Clostridia bacterium]
MKNKIIYGLIIIMVFSAIFIGFTYRSVQAYQVVVDGKNVALYQEEDEAKEYANKLQSDLNSRYDVDIKLESRIDIEEVEVRVNSKDLNTCEDVDDITDNLKCKIEGYQIVLDGKDTGLKVEDKDVMDKVIEEFKGKLEIKADKYQVDNQIDYRKNFYHETEFSSWDQIKDYFLTPFQSEKTHIVKEGDTLWDISNEYDIDVEEIEKLNSGLTEDLKLGQEIKLKGSAYRLNILYTSDQTKEKSIPYETETKETDKMYKGEQKVEQEGENGTKEITYKVYYKNGEKYKEEEISEKILKEPVNKIILKGNKEKPVIRRRAVSNRSGRSRSYGNISSPACGYISSSYGSRGGSHTGVDIAGPYGSSVCAAMGGRVIFTGWSGGYGKLIKIQHSNGLVTYYAHLSSFNVGSGQQVSAGQRIGSTGSTGRSTGPHLHFEVRRGGRPINPMGYVR